MVESPERDRLRDLIDVLVGGVDQPGTAEDIDQISQPIPLRRLNHMSILRPTGSRRLIVLAHLAAYPGS